MGSEIKVGIRHEYRGVPYEVEFTLSDMGQLDLLGDVIDEVVRFIDGMLEERNRTEISEKFETSEKYGKGG